MDNKFHSLCDPAHPVSATQLSWDHLNVELQELDDSKKISIAKKRGFSKTERRIDMIRNILHMKIFVTNLFKGKG